MAKPEVNAHSGKMKKITIEDIRIVPGLTGVVSTIRDKDDANLKFDAEKETVTLGRMKIKVTGRGPSRRARLTGFPFDGTLLITLTELTIPIPVPAELDVTYIDDPPSVRPKPKPKYAKKKAPAKKPRKKPVRKSVKKK